MKVVLFGATGMVGSGALRECLLDPAVEQVVTVGRAETGQKHDKLRELVHKDLGDLGPIEAELTDIDACFFCLGVSSVGQTEENYHRITYDYAMAAAQTLAHQNPGLVFIYISGAGTDSSEKGTSMWARVKGKTENALLKLSFIDAYMFRPGYIQPVHGVVSKTRLYRTMYAVAAPLFPVWKRLFPKSVVTTETLGRAMLAVAKNGAPERVLTNADINALANALAASPPSK